MLAKRGSDIRLIRDTQERRERKGEKEMMENMDILKDKRFRRAVLDGGLYRCVAIYLRIQYPDVQDLSTLPNDVLENARIQSWNAIHANLQERAQMEKEMR